MSEFLNKTVIVTGGFRGNGLSISENFLKHGAKVFSIDRNSGIYNEIWTNKKLNSTEYFNGKCSLAKKKF